MKKDAWKNLGRNTWLISQQLKFFCWDERMFVSNLLKKGGRIYLFSFPIGECEKLFLHLLMREGLAKIGKFYLNWKKADEERQKRCAAIGSRKEEMWGRNNIGPQMDGRKDKESAVLSKRATPTPSSQNWNYSKKGNCLFFVGTFKMRNGRSFWRGWAAEIKENKYILAHGQPS